MVPILIGLAFGWMPPGLVLLSMVNGFLSAADVIGAILLVLQTDRSAILRKKGLETWWRTPD